jgi:hypothetical protein
MLTKAYDYIVVARIRIVVPKKFYIEVLPAVARSCAVSYRLMSFGLELALPVLSYISICSTVWWLWASSRDIALVSPSSSLRTTSRPNFCLAAMYRIVQLSLPMQSNLEF